MKSFFKRNAFQTNEIEFIFFFSNIWPMTRQGVRGSWDTWRIMLYNSNHLGLFSDG